MARSASARPHTAVLPKPKYRSCPRAASAATSPATAVLSKSKIRSSARRPSGPMSPETPSWYGGPLHGNGGRRCDVVSYGGLAYRSLITQYTLTEPCRQKASDGLYRELQKARNAVTDSDSATFWNGRQELHLGREEREAFQKVDTPKLLFLTCTRKAAADVNAAYIGTQSC